MMVKDYNEAQMRASIGRRPAATTRRASNDGSRRRGLVKKMRARSFEEARPQAEW